VQGVDGAQKATQAISHADMRRATTARPAIVCRRGAGRPATGVAAVSTSGSPTTTVVAAAVVAAAVTVAAYGSRARLSEDGDDA